MRDTAETTQAFIDAINRHDVDALGALMSEDHVFTDSLGVRIEGREPMLGGWRGYLALFPDYTVKVETLLADGETALMHGRAAATLHRDDAAVDGGAWDIPSAWRAVVRDGRIAEWQVYADNRPVHALLNS